MLSPNESIDDLFDISALVVVTITPRFQLGHFGVRENNNNTVISAPSLINDSDVATPLSSPILWRRAPVPSSEYTLPPV